MFNRYWREYPWFLQVLQFTIMVFIFIGFASALVALLVTRLTGVPLTDLGTVTEHIPHAKVNAILLSQFLMVCCAFLIPPFLFAYITHPRPAWYLGMRPPGKPVQWILTIFVILGAGLVFVGITQIVSQIDFGASVKAAQEKNDTLMKALLTIPTFGDFLKTFFVLAILPGFSEELLFRGILMRFSAHKMNNILFPIIISAVLFAWAHSNPYGLPAIFLAGILLGSIYYLTGSIWCSILAHVVHNGIQIWLSYLANDNGTLRNAIDNTELPWYLPVAGLIVFSISMYLLYKNRTPLPANWADDFSGEKREHTDNFTD